MTRLHPLIAQQDVPKSCLSLPRGLSVTLGERSQFTARGRFDVRTPTASIKVAIRARSRFVFRDDETKKEEDRDSNEDDIHGRRNPNSCRTHDQFLKRGSSASCDHGEKISGGR